MKDAHLSMQKMCIFRVKRCTSFFCLFYDESFYFREGTFYINIPCLTIMDFSFANIRKIFEFKFFFY
ncbi:MAG: hypothetical protein H6Q16_1088 [Bacteroidetes bacterium]|nr:hypothetical protein [Bacteroidota bacterium]